MYMVNGLAFSFAIYQWKDTYTVLLKDEYVHVYMYDFIIMHVCIFPIYVAIAKSSCVYAYVTGFDKTRLARTKN